MSVATVIERSTKCCVAPCSMADKHCVLRCTFSAPTHSAVVLQGLSALRSRGQLLDVVLAVNEERFQVHKAVLASCSDYFRYDVSPCQIMCV